METYSLVYERTFLNRDFQSACVPAAIIKFLSSGITHDRLIDCNFPASDLNFVSVLSALCSCWLLLVIVVSVLILPRNPSGNAHFGLQKTMTYFETIALSDISSSVHKVAKSCSYIYCIYLLLYTYCLKYLLSAFLWEDEWLFIQYLLILGSEFNPMYSFLFSSVVE